MRGIDRTPPWLCALRGGVTVPAALLAAAVLVVFVLQVQRWAFLADDAFISFRYARNLAEHGALEFNLGERVEGYTNFLWVLQLGVLARLGVAPHQAAPVLTAGWSAFALIGTVVLTATLRRRFDNDDDRILVVDVVPAALLVASPEAMAWTGSGLETSMGAATVIASWTAWMRGRVIGAAAWAAAAVLTRPDAALPIAIFGLVWLGIVGGPALRSDKTAALQHVDRRRVLIAALVFVVPVVAHLLWRRVYYGAWLPNTWTIKAHGRLLRDTYGIWYLRAWVDATHLLVLAPLAAMLRPRHALLIVPAGAVIFYGWWVGGDFMAYARFYLVATMALATLVGWLLADGARVIGRRLRRPVVLRGIAAAVGLALAVSLGVLGQLRLQADREKPTGWLDGKWEGITAMDRFARVGLVVGGWMHEHLPPDTVITVGAAGAVPYASQLPTIDAFGLVDPNVASLPGAGPFTGRGARPGHQLQAPVGYVKERDPDLLCHVGYRGPRRPPPGWTHRAFRRGYTWACIEPDPVQGDAGEDGAFDVGFYCCRRPRDRSVGPFGETLP